MSTADNADENEYKFEFDTIKQCNYFLDFFLEYRAYGLQQTHVLYTKGSTPPNYKNTLEATWRNKWKPAYEANDGPGKMNERIAEITGLTLENYV